MLFLEKVEKIAEKHPERTAVISGDKNIKYGELITRAKSLSCFVAANSEKGKPVVVIGHKDPMMHISFLACAEAGHAYCPVDITTPIDRVNSIIERIDDPLVLIAEENAEKYAEKIKGGRLASFDEIRRESKNNASQETSPLNEEDTIYIIFTSGSTGAPKGVEISHGALSRFTDWSSDLIQGKTDDECIYMNQAPYSFDLSVFDTHTALSAGGTIFCLTKQMQKEMRDLLDALRESNANYWVSTPSFADLCLSDKNFSSELMPELKSFIFCGEKLDRSTAAKLRMRFPNSAVINTYGPTESTVAVTAVEITDEMIESDKELPIGTAKPGTRISLDPENKEIIISGDTVSKGYFKDKEKSAAVFAEDEKGERSYRTGDSGFFDGDMLYYTGRLDFQIKLHGYRIELGDIESNLIDIEDIERAVVLPTTKNGKIRYLSAYIMAGREMEKNEIKKKLAEKLPEYMVPKRILFLDSMPLNNNGKVDRKALEKMIGEGR